MRAALVNKKGVVQNVVLLPEGWSGKKDEWKKPAWLKVVFDETVNIGDVLQGGNFVSQEPDFAEPEPEPLKADEIAALRALLQEKGVILP